MTPPGSPYASLTDCVRDIADHYPQRNTLIEGTEIMNDRRGIAEAPKFLFRGEEKCFSNTYSSVERLRHSTGLPVRELEWICKQVKNETARELGIHDHAAHAFLQHYGLPTEWIDFTSDLSVAAAFASKGEVGGNGLIGVLDVEVAAGSGANITRFTNLKPAVRAQRQSAFSLHPMGLGDLKLPDTSHTLGLKWFRFAMTATDKTLYSDKIKSLLDEWQDPMSGFLRHQMNRYVTEVGKFEDTIAVWLVDRIPIVPLIGRLVPESEEIEFTGPPSEKCRTEKERSRRYWSKAYPKENVPLSSGWPLEQFSRCPGT